MNPPSHPPRRPTPARLPGGAIGPLHVQCASNPPRVPLASASPFGTVAGRDGARASGAQVQDSAAGTAWAFALLAADQANAVATRAVSPLPLRADGRAHSVGVRDVPAGRPRLHVDGVPTGLVGTVGAAPHRTGPRAVGAAWAAGGAFTIGRGRWRGGNAGHFPGRIDRLKISNGASVRVVR